MLRVCSWVLLFAITVPLSLTYAADSVSADSAFVAPSVSGTSINLGESASTTGLALGGNSSKGDTSVSQGKSTSNQPNLQSKIVSGDCLGGGGRSPFQNLLCQSNGTYLSHFGYSTLAGGAGGFAPNGDAPVSLEYPIGVGDELLIRVWGGVEFNQKVVVDKNGMIYLPTVGNILVAGVLFAEVENVISEAISRYYKGYRLAVSSGQLRSIPIFVTGFSNQPGRYTVSGLSTVINALLSSGGVAANGSLRNIELRRAGKLISKIDLYEFLLYGDKSIDRRLEPGDVIHIPAVGSQVAILGAVNLPAIYELKGGEAADILIRWAGGLNAVSKDSKILLERIKNRKIRAVDVVDFTDLPKTILRQGDILQIANLTMQYDQSVVLRSSFGVILRLPYKSGMKISDLIPSPDSILSSRYWAQKNTLANNPNQNADQTMSEIRNNIDLEVNWDYAVIQRRSPLDFSNTLLGFNLAKAINKDSKEDKELKPDDIVTVFSKGDLRVPGSKLKKFVYIEGEVAIPGVYEVEENETLTHLLERIGGLTQDAFLYGLVLTREEVKQRQKQSLEELATYLEKKANSQINETAQNATSPSAFASVESQKQALQAALFRLRNANPNGRVVLDVELDVTSIKELPVIRLQDGDAIFVPNKPSVVTVAGSVFNKNPAFVYKNGAKIGQYIQLAGGVTEDAESDSTHVIRANGAVESRRGKWFSSVESLPTYPGDLIVVPEKIDKTNFVKHLVDWTQVIANFGFTAAALKSLGN